MIGKPIRGNDMRKCVEYLFGEGEQNEHADQHVIAAQSALGVPVGRELTKAEVTELAGMMSVASDLHGTWLEGGHVYHVPLSTKGGTDRDLSDPEWAQVATEMVERLGFDGPAVTAPCAWVAVRHGKSADGNDHVHLVVNLVRTGGRPAAIRGDWPKITGVCTDMEARFGLTTIEARGTKRGLPSLSRGEIAKAKRLAQPDPERVELARAVRALSLACTTEAEFPRRLRGAGYAVIPTYDRSGQHRVVGYSVARQPGPGEVTVFFSGSKLGKDLTLGQLRNGWQQTPTSGAQAAAEWGNKTAQGGLHTYDPSGRHRLYTWTEATAEWGPRRPAVTVDGRETERWTPNQWTEAAVRMGQVVKDLAEIPLDDIAAWQFAAHTTAGVYAAMSQRLEPVPGPLASAADTMARSAQGQVGGATAAAFAPTGTLRNVSAVMAQAAITDESAVAWQLMLAELLALAKSIQAAHAARGEAQASQRITDTVCTALQEAHAHYGTSSRVAEMIPALAAEVERDLEGDEDERPGPKKRKPSGAMRAEDYAALAARQRRPQRDPSRGIDR